MYINTIQNKYNEIYCLLENFLEMAIERISNDRLIEYFKYKQINRIF